MLAYFSASVIVTNEPAVVEAARAQLVLKQSLCILLIQIQFIDVGDCLFLVIGCFLFFGEWTFPSLHFRTRFVRTGYDFMSAPVVNWAGGIDRPKRHLPF